MNETIETPWFDSSMPHIEKENVRLAPETVGVGGEMRILEEEDIRLVASLVGRRIEKSLWYDESPDSQWASHQRCVLWLDDGRIIEFGSWGYDADGATIDDVTDDAANERIRQLWGNGKWQI